MGENAHWCTFSTSSQQQICPCGFFFPSSSSYFHKPSSCLILNRLESPSSYSKACTLIFGVLDWEPVSCVPCFVVGFISFFVASKEAELQCIWDQVSLFFLPSVFRNSAKSCKNILFFVSFFVISNAPRLKHVSSYPRSNYKLFFFSFVLLCCSKEHIPHYIYGSWGEIV